MECIPSNIEIKHTVFETLFALRNEFVVGANVQDTDQHFSHYKKKKRKQLKLVKKLKLFSIYLFLQQRGGTR